MFESDNRNQLGEDREWLGVNVFCKAPGPDRGMTYMTNTAKIFESII